MTRHSRPSRRGGRRPGFTLVEMLLASMVTAMTAVSAAALVFAIANAASHTRDYRTQRAEGHYALHRIGHKIRTARGIGEVTPTTVSLWEQDDNNDDTVNLYEVGIIRYDSANRQIVYERRVSQDPPPATVVDSASFFDTTALAGMLEGADRQTVVWANDVESLTFSGYPEHTDTRVVHVEFTLIRENESLVFHKSAAPRASGDYLFVTEAMIPADGPDGRARRKYSSRWDGYGDLANPLPWELLEGP